MVSSIRIVGVPEPESRWIETLLEGHGLNVVVDGEPSGDGGSLEPAHILTARHIEILRALHRHGSAPAAAGALGISVRTVNCHLNEIYQRLDVHRAVHAVCWACRRGLLGD